MQCFGALRWLLSTPVHCFREPQSLLSHTCTSLSTTLSVQSRLQASFGLSLDSLWILWDALGLPLGVLWVALAPFGMPVDIDHPLVSLWPLWATFGCLGPPERGKKLKTITGMCFYVFGQSAQKVQKLMFRVCVFGAAKAN